MQNLDEIEKKAEAREAKRKKKRRGGMKMSGGGVKKLQRIIKDKKD